MKPGLISSIKAFIVASSLSVTSAAAVFAATPGSTSTITYTPMALGPQATTSLSNLYVNPPMGAVTLGGIPFNLSNFVLLRPGQSVTIPTSIQLATGAYLLLNSGNTGMWAAGQTEGSVRLSFSNGTFQDTSLIVGSNIREWYPGGGTVGWLSSPTATNVWSGSGALIDMLTITIAPTTATLTGVTVNNQAPYWLNMQLNGLTIAADPPAPAVAPGNQDENDEAGDDAGTPNSQAWGEKVEDQVEKCKDAAHKHGIGECVSDFARQHGQAHRQAQSGSHKAHEDAIDISENEQAQDD